MSTVSKIHFNNGRVPTATELNAAYTGLVTASGNIEAENTASGWATYEHFDPAAYQCNRLDQYNNNTTSTTTYNNTSYVNIAQGGNDATIVFASFIPDQYEMTRFSASGLVAASTLATDVGATNYYAFRLYLTYRDSGGADQYLTVGEWGYSFSSRALVTDLNSGLLDPLQYQTFSFSKVLRNEAADGVRQYRQLSLQVKVNDGSNTVGISRHQLYSISAKG